MNRLEGTITSVETDGHVSLVTVEAVQTVFSSLIIDTPDAATYLQVGKPVFIVFQETEMSIGKNVSGMLSLRNRFAGKITAIEQGKILTKIKLDFKGYMLSSLITTSSAINMGLQTGDQVEGLVKTNELSLMEKPQ